jgi:3-(methylsulfanyl)propanoyl-CoA dehydrogenase
MVAQGTADPARALTGAVPYLRLAGGVTGGWLMAQGALAAQRHLAERRGDARFHEAKLVTARFYAEHILAAAPALMPAITGGATVMSFDLEQF